MRVADILDQKGRAVATTTPDATLLRVAAELRLRGIGALVVSADGEHLDGLIAESDLVHGLARFGHAVLDMHVRDLMRRGVPTCTPNDTVHHVMTEMTRWRARHLPVLEHGTLCGIVSIGDVVKIRLDAAEQELTVLRDAYLASH
jgi:CBS domain-containing protein